MKRHFWLDRALLIVGVALLAIYAGIRVDGFVHSRARLRAFEERKEEQRVNRTESGKKQLVSNRPVDFSLWDSKRIDEYKQSLLADLEAPVAILRIPKIGLEVPVLDGTDDVSLNRGVGRIAGTAHEVESGNMGIAGHRDGFFRGLKDIMRGDVVELETIDARASYVVDELEIVDPSDTAVLRPRSKPAVTLVTCYPFYFTGSAPNRFIVHASLTQVIPATNAQVASGHAIPKNENN
jgi:sortase A